MKRMLALLLICSLALPLLPGCAPLSAAQELKAPDIHAAPLESGDVNQALSAFAFSLLQRTRSEENQAVLVSPLSVSMALSMAANGSDGDTLAQFEVALAGGATLDELNSACAQLMADYQNLGGSTQCSLANSLWADPEGQIQEDFVGKCRGVFNAQVFQSDLSHRTIVNDLNSWVSDHTNKLIPKIITDPFPEGTAALLVNALYLNNTWASKFDPNSTRQRDFTHGDGGVEPMDFLNRGSSSLDYIQGKEAQGVVLPYDDGRLAFVSLMPDPGSPDLGQWLDSFQGDELSRLIQEARKDTRFLHLALPKFEAEWRGELTGVLSDLGLDTAFDPERADFSLLGNTPEGYYLSQVLHAAKIKVNEKGTEAAAATVVAASGSGAPSQDGVTLIFDHPFLYGIVDLETGIPLFLGTYE